MVTVRSLMSNTDISINLLTLAEVASILKVSKLTVHRMVKKGAATSNQGWKPMANFGKSIGEMDRTRRSLQTLVADNRQQNGIDHAIVLHLS